MKLSPWILGVFLIGGFFATNYTLNHFYVNGGYMLDSGWFAYLAAHSETWPPRNPPSVGGVYFSTHFSPAFYIFTAFYKLIGFSGFFVSEAIWFSVIQGLWLAVAASAIFVLLAVNSKPFLVNKIFISVTSLLLAYNGVFLASIGFPHFEIGMPALLMAFFAARISGHKAAAWLFLCFGLLLREDAGFHYCGIFSIFAIYLYFAGDNAISRQVKFYLLLSIGCFGYSLASMFVQKKYFGADHDMLSHVYLGSPVYAHVSWRFIQERFDFFIKNRLYILVPMMLMVFFGGYKGKSLLLVGVCAVVPWIVFSIFAVSPQAGTLTSYYAFPVAIALFWPAVARSLFVQSSADMPGKYNITTKEIFIITISSLVFYPISQGNHDRSPWKDFWPKWRGEIAATHRSLNSFVKTNNEAKFIYDDSVASLLVDGAAMSQWRYAMEFSDEELKSKQGIVFQPGAWLTGRVKDAGIISDFRYFCRIPHTRYAVLSSQDNLEYCEYSKSMSGYGVDLSPEIFDYLQGWSHKEADGRWTVGGDIMLPTMKASHHDKICFEGHGYLPDPSSKIKVEVYIRNSLMGEFEYDKSNSGGVRCAPFPLVPLGDAGKFNINLKIIGYSSPMSRGESVDDRLLGVFVKRIYLE